MIDSEFFADPKIIMALLGIITLAGVNIYYIYTVIWGNVKPHAYTWLIWAIILLIAAAAQYHGEGGYGVYVTLWACLNCSINTILGFVKGNNLIKLSDQICLGLCLVAIILWQITKDPLLSVFLVTTIDGAAFYPSIRKSWNDPYNENAVNFTFANIPLFLGILALENYSLITVFYPAAIIILNLSFASFLLIRRYQLKNA